MTVPKEFIVDTGSPVTQIPPDKELIKVKKKLPVTRNYHDVNKNEAKFTVKITVEAETEGIRKNLSILITEREYIKLLLGIDSLREFNWTIRHIEKTTTITDQSEI